MKKKRFSHLNEGFQCENCAAQVPVHEHGSCRNHCNHCLYSRHVDENPGDRSASCGALMKPVFVDVTGTEPVIFFQCLRCGKTGKNKSSPDDRLDTILELLGQNHPIPSQ